MIGSIKVATFNVTSFTQGMTVSCETKSKLGLYTCTCVNFMTSFRKIKFRPPNLSMRFYKSYGRIAL